MGLVCEPAGFGSVCEMLLEMGGSRVCTMNWMGWEIYDGGLREKEANIAWEHFSVSEWQKTSLLLAASPSLKQKKKMKFSKEEKTSVPSFLEPLIFSFPIKFIICAPTVYVMCVSVRVA